MVESDKIQFLVYLQLLEFIFQKNHLYLISDNQDFWG